MNPVPQRRRPLLAAAIEVFAERGYAGTSVDHLSAAMKLDPAAFRQRFTTREGCFLAAYDRIVAAAQARLVASLHGEAPWAARVATGLHWLLELMTPTQPPPASSSSSPNSPAKRRFSATRRRSSVCPPFMREGRRCPTAPEHLPPILDSVLPTGVVFGLRCQLVRGEPVRDLSTELLRFLLLPYLGEAETAACLVRSSR
jgi:AcrR family transcriptional regulator